MTAVQPSLAWARAQVFLQRYDEHGDPADLDAGIELLLDSTNDPAHPEPIACQWLLSNAYGERAHQSDQVDDYDEAIGWARRLAEWLVPGDPDTDELSVHLADLHWDRSWSLRYRPDAAAEDARELVDALAELQLSGANPIAGEYVRLLLGAARLEQYGDIDSPLDRHALDAGIADAGPAMTALLQEDANAVAEWVGDDRLALLGGLLGHAYGARFDLDGNPDDLDRAVSLLEASVQRGGPPLLLRSYLREAYQRRWEKRRQPSDLDAAVAVGESMLTVPSGELDEFAAFDLAELLVERASERKQPQDARMAVALFEQVATATTLDAMLPWYRAHEANHLLWNLTGEPAALDAAAQRLDQVLALGPESSYDLLTAHTNRLNIERTRTEAGLAPPLDPARPGKSAFRDLLEAAFQAFDRCTDADPEDRATTAVSLVFAELSVAGYDLGAYDAERMRDLLTMAETADLGGVWSALIEVGFAQLEMVEGLNDRRVGDMAVQRLARVAGSDALGWEARPLAHSLLAMAMNFRAGTVGDRRSAGVGRATMRRRTTAPATQEPAFDVFLRLEPLMRDGDVKGIARLVAEAAPALDTAMPGTAEGYMADFIRLVRAAVDPEWVESESTPLPSVDPRAALLPGQHGVMQRALGSMTAGVLHARGFVTNDIGLLRRAAEQNDAVFATLPVGDQRLRLGTLSGAGLSYLEMARRSLPPYAAAATAVERFTAAMDLAGGHRHTLWPVIAMHCAEAIRLTADPDRARSRQLGWSALRAHAWQVFAQTGTDHALAAARSASEHARKIARWCVEDGADDDLVGLLDAGRALVLRAATSSRSVADRLVELGRHDLADEWRETSGLGRNRLTGEALAAHMSADDDLVVPDELRFEVLAALGDEGEVAGLRPVTVGDIQSALVAGAVDALVYLVLGEQPQPGLAVIVPAHGDVITKQLSALRADEGSPLHGFVETSGVVRDVAAVEPLASNRSLISVCDWAWNSAMAEVLAAMGGKADRLVLLPFGVLSTVPWHAACTWRDGRRHFLIEDTLVSYSPSARMFCDGGPFAPAEIRSALVVGNPGGDLTFAGVEARAIHRQFYPDGAYFGSDAERAGTPDDVLDWISSSPVGPTVLHFACHAAIAADRPSEAHLILADGATLSADTLLHRSRTAALDIEQVFLAGCTTSGTRSVHDEVLSLASTFLAAGARTVVGSLWPAPDTETSLLMFMVHRYLRVHGCAPAEALRRAQRWMLASDRDVPSDFPDELRAQCPPGTEFDLAAWAGFIHFGR